MENPRAVERLVAIGNFDGVHLGHQAVLSGAVRDAESRGLEPSILTFDPHPAAVIGRAAPPMLTPLARKIELMKNIQPSVSIIVQSFDREFAAQSPDEFAEKILARHLSAKLVLVGKNFRFGRGRAGDFSVLARLGEKFGFETRSHSLAGDEHGTFSSTRAREAIRAGDLAAARAVLGRPHALSGTVVEGDRRGRTIGFPTANLAGHQEALPAFGVYAVVVDRLLGDDPVTGAARGVSLARGVANIGVRPTVKVGAPPSVEVNLFNFSGDLYGARLRVHLVARLRGEARFESLDALRSQIARDAEAARDETSLISSPPPDQPWW